MMTKLCCVRARKRARPRSSWPNCVRRADHRGRLVRELSSARELVLVVLVVLVVLMVLVVGEKVARRAAGNLRLIESTCNK